MILDRVTDPLLVEIEDAEREVMQRRNEWALRKAAHETALDELQAVKSAAAATARRARDAIHNLEEAETTLQTLMLQRERRRTGRYRCESASRSS